MGLLLIILLSIVCAAIVLNIVSNNNEYPYENHKHFFNDNIKFTEEDSYSQCDCDKEKDEEKCEEKNE